MFYVCHENRKGKSARKHAKILRYCYYVLAAVYELSLICRNVHLKSMVNCPTPTTLNMPFTFNCNA